MKDLTKIKNWLTENELRLFSTGMLNTSDNEQFRHDLDTAMNRIAEYERHDRVLQYRHEKREYQVLKSSDRDTHAVIFFEVIERVMGITRAQIVSKNRNRKIVLARKMLSKLMYEHTKHLRQLSPLRFSMDVIGTVYQGGRDHSTIVHQIQTLHDHLDTEKLTRLQYDQARRMIEEAFAEPVAPELMYEIEPVQELMEVMA